MRKVILSAGDLTLEILPELGGAITRFSAGDFPIFRETPTSPATVSDCASFPLIPFSNRIRAGSFSWNGETYQIPTDKRDPRITNHGHTRHLPWEITDASPTSLTLQFRQSAPSASWPFPFTAEQKFTFAPGRLTMQASIRNDHSAPAPAGIGFHPYFTRLADTALGFKAGCVWETDALDIPVRSVAPSGRFDFSTIRPLETPLINHAYSGWNGDAEIIHPGRFHIAVTASGAFNHLILFTPEGKNAFGFEPVSHRPDALNPLPDPNDTGMASLPPGATLQAQAEIAITIIP